MAAECQVCKGRAHTYLCGKCERQLRDDLASLGWWLDRLVESAVGQVRLGDGGRRTTPTIHGDDTLASHLGPLPGCECEDECDCDTVIARRKRHRAALAHALALGRVNATASELHAEANATLTTWVRHLVESRGVTWRPVRTVEIGFIGPLMRGWRRIPSGYAATTIDMAKWLRANVSAIANDEAAGELVDELADIRKRIERAVNPGSRSVWIGQCPTWIEGTRQACGVSLWAPEDAIQTRCRHCGVTHNCDRLKLLLFGDLEREKVPWSRILQANKSQPTDRQISDRTLQLWRKLGKLKVRGYDGDTPLFLWPDVRRLRDEKPQKMKTGAAAHKRRSSA